MAPRHSKALDPVNQRAVELVRGAFTSSGLSRKELAERSGVPDGTLAGLFAGTKPIYTDQLVGLALALGADAAAWLGELMDVRRKDLPKQ